MQKMIRRLLEPTGITSLTPIQEESIEAIHTCDTLVLYAPTGSGKTLAFLLPLLQLLHELPESGQTDALILSPTRELALQIEQVFKSLKSNCSVTTCYGGHSMKVETNNLSAGPRVIIGTPGRLADHLRRENIHIRQTPYMVVDEFDKCLEMGFSDELQLLFKEARGLKKLLLASATKMEEFPSYVPLRNVNYVDQIHEDALPDIQYFGIPDYLQKLDTIETLIALFEHEPAILFCNFRDDAAALGEHLDEQGIAVSVYHGGLEQDERERALIKFRNGSCPVLICTDLGSRGLDIPEVAHIVHFQLPEKEAPFIHRNGRTARMSASGKVYYFQEDAEQADYQLPDTGTFSLPKDAPLYYPPIWKTLYFSAGKKNKINKIDLLGFICQKGELDKQQVGMITVLDFASYVAVQSEDPHELLRKMRLHKVKGQKLRMALSK